MFHDKDTSSYCSFRVLWDVASKMFAITSFLCVSASCFIYCEMNSPLLECGLVLVTFWTNRM